MLQNGGNKDWKWGGRDRERKAADLTLYLNKIPSAVSVSPVNQPACDLTTSGLLQCKWTWLMEEGVMLAEKGLWEASDASKIEGDGAKVTVRIQSLPYTLHSLFIYLSIPFGAFHVTVQKPSPSGCCIGDPVPAFQHLCAQWHCAKIMLWREQAEWDLIYYRPIPVYLSLFTFSFLQEMAVRNE